MSDIAKGFVVALLEKDPGERLTAQQALNHPWLDKRHELESLQPSPEPKSAVGLDRDTLGQLMEYRGMSKLRMAGINLLVSMLQSKDITPLRAVFEEIDKDQTGFITPEELSQAIG